KKIIYLFASCCLLLCSQTTQAGNFDLLSAAAFPQPCTLSAPSNLQYTQPTSYTVHFTWDPVPGAAGYRSVLMNLSNGTQQATEASPADATFAVTPGDFYEFTVAAMCSLNPPETSSNRSQMNLMAQTIIIDLIAKFYGCTPTGAPIYYSFSSTNTFSYNWAQGVFYYFELGKFVLSNPRQPGYIKKAWLAFQHTDEYGYVLAEFDSNEEPSVLCGQPVTPPPPPSNNCVVAPVSNVSNAKFTFDGRTCRIAFPSMTEIYYYYDSSVGSNEQPFDYFRIYEGCGGERAGGDESPPFQVAAVNPFTDQLTLYFAAPPDAPVKTRLFDLQGIPVIETLIQPGQLSGNAYSIPTDVLPAGMYFLNVETLTGQVVVQKVLKI
ncbi:MAG TPA: T9SS type A sorting domain-containing protein, partial [Saprospiraceae bacterium]|nr:T9SS type A sorting domain-containing protein [Saprospiraceae bacterium]